MITIMSWRGKRMGRGLMKQRLGLWIALVSVGVCLWGAPIVQRPMLALAQDAQQRPAAAAPQQPGTPRPPAAQDEFVPIDQVPEHDKLPAAPYLIAAYTVAWLMVLGYVWSLWRRLSRVEDELRRLAPGSSKS